MRLVTVEVGTGGPKQLPPPHLTEWSSFTCGRLTKLNFTNLTKLLNLSKRCQNMREAIHYLQPLTLRASSKLEKVTKAMPMLRVLVLSFSRSRA